MTDRLGNQWNAEYTKEAIRQAAMTVQTTVLEPLYRWLRDPAVDARMKRRIVKALTASGLCSHRPRH